MNTLISVELPHNIYCQNQFDLAAGLIKQSRKNPEFNKQINSLARKHNIDDGVRLLVDVLRGKYPERLDFSAVSFITDFREQFGLELDCKSLGYIVRFHTFTTLENYQIEGEVDNLQWQQIEQIQFLIRKSIDTAMAGLLNPSLSQKKNQPTAVDEARTDVENQNTTSEAGEPETQREDPDTDEIQNTQGSYKENFQKLLVAEKELSLETREEIEALFSLPEEQVAYYTPRFSAKKRKELLENILILYVQPLFEVYRKNGRTSSKNKTNFLKRYLSESSGKLYSALNTYVGSTLSEKGGNYFFGYHFKGIVKLIAEYNALKNLGEIQESAGQTKEEDQKIPLETREEIENFFASSQERVSHYISYFSSKERKELLEKILTLYAQPLFEVYKKSGHTDSKNKTGFLARYLSNFFSGKYSNFVSIISGILNEERGRYFFTANFDGIVSLIAEYNALEKPEKTPTKEDGAQKPQDPEQEVNGERTPTEENTPQKTQDPKQEEQSENRETHNSALDSTETQQDDKRGQESTEQTKEEDQKISLETREEIENFFASSHERVSYHTFYLSPKERKELLENIIKLYVRLLFVKYKNEGKTNARNENGFLVEYLTNRSNKSWSHIKASIYNILHEKETRLFFDFHFNGIRDLIAEYNALENGERTPTEENTPQKTQDPKQEEQSENRETHNSALDSTETQQDDKRGQESTEQTKEEDQKISLETREEIENFFASPQKQAVPYSCHLSSQERKRLLENIIEMFAGPLFEVYRENGSTNSRNETGFLARYLSEFSGKMYNTLNVAISLVLKEKGGNYFFKYYFTAIQKLIAECKNLEPKEVSQIKASSQKSKAANLAKKSRKLKKPTGTKESSRVTQYLDGDVIESFFDLKLTWAQEIFKEMSSSQKKQFLQIFKYKYFDTYVSLQIDGGARVKDDFLKGIQKGDESIFSRKNVFDTFLTIVTACSLHNQNNSHGGKPQEKSSKNNVLGMLKKAQEDTKDVVRKPKNKKEMRTYIGMLIDSYKLNPSTRKGLDTRIVTHTKNHRQEFLEDLFKIYNQTRVNNDRQALPYALSFEEQKQVLGMALFKGKDLRESIGKFETWFHSNVRGILTLVDSMAHLIRQDNIELLNFKIEIAGKQYT